MPTRPAAFRHSAFRWFTLSRVFSVLGNQMVSVAIGWQVYELTGSPLALGLIGLVQVAPILGLALWAGQFADRADRRNIMIGTQLLHGLASLGLAGLAVQAHPSLPLIYAMLLLKGVAGAFQMPAAQALMPSLVPQEIFPGAVAWRSVTFELASLGGPVLGGFLIHRFGPGPAYLGNVVLSLVAVVMLLQIPCRAQAATSPPPGGLLDGLRFVWSRQVILGALTLDLFAVLFAGATALYPVFARDILHVGPQGLGLLKGASSIGSVLMSIWLLNGPPIRRAGRLLLVTVTAYGLFMIGFGLSTWFWLSVACLAATGAADAVSVLIRHTVVQMRTPDAMRGKVSAVNGVFFRSSNELGEMESGIAASLVGAGASVVLGGLVTLGVVGFCAWRFPDLRRLGRLDDGQALGPAVPGQDHALH